MIQDSEFYKTGFELAIKNASSLQKVAKMAAESNEFGMACSLNILSAEEALKAIFLVLKSNYPENDIEGFDKIFRSHKFKHDYIVDFLILNDSMQAINLKWINQIEPKLNSFMDLIKDYPIEIPNELHSVKAEIEWLKNKSEEKIDLEGVLSWLKTANNDKNRGFYVDILKDEWQSPQDFDNKKYAVEKDYTIGVINYARTLNEVFERVGNLNM